MAESPPAARGLVLRGGELISVVSALLLVVIIFALKWFGLALTPGPRAARSHTPSAENAWNGLTMLRWVMAVTIVVAVGSAIVRASQRHHGSQTNTGLPIMALGCVTSALLIYRVVIDLPSPRTVVDQKLGAYLGVLAALGIALGGYQAFRDERALGRASEAESETPLGAPSEV